MNVLLVTDWEDVRGGMEECAVQTREALRQAGAQVTVVAVGQQHAAEADFSSRAPRTPALRALSQLANPVAAVDLARLRRRIRPDVVHLFAFEHETSPAALRALRGLPTAATIHNYKPTCPTAHRLLPGGSVCELSAGRVCVHNGCVGHLHHLRDRPRYAMIGAALRRCRLIAPSAWLARRLGEHRLYASVVQHAVAPPPASFARAPAAAPTIVSIARLLRVKGIDVLLHAFSRVLVAHPEANLRVVGGGPEVTHLRELAARLEVDHAVSFRGEVPNAADVELRDAWALAAPSLWEEAFGLVAAEAVMRGVPVVASRSGGLSETVTEGRSGHLVANGSIEELATALARVVAAGPADVPLEERRRIADRHAHHRHAGRLMDLYRQLANGSRAAGRALPERPPLGGAGEDR